ncbi:hypothetical protein BleG1_2853 [Shouchella lehensis G1]|uniref:HTH cro/C1-type domain-containing protein n=1 Tax=Shouchella lehensis G1 TaxID=1246626 RepID=A0A060LYZ6_9BACI|nr:hypothetical protein BleG1_2853 [Shouchella lehensis G1]
MNDGVDLKKIAKELNVPLDELKKVIDHCRQENAEHERKQ